MARAGNVIFRGQISPDRYRPLYNGITLKYFFCVRRTTWAAWKVNENAGISWRPASSNLIAVYSHLPNHDRFSSYSVFV